MRWSYLIPRLIIVFVVWALVAFGLDPLLRSTTQSTLQSITGAKADIGTFQTGFFPPSLDVHDVQLANARRPGRNLVSFDSVRLELAGDALLRKSWVVNHAVIHGLDFDTPRADDGLLPDAPIYESDEPAIPDWLTERAEQYGSEWLDGFLNQAKQSLDPSQLESYQVGNELYTKWNDRFRQLETQLRAARTELDVLKQKVEQAKSGQPLQQLEQYVEVARRADLLLRDSRRLMDEFRHVAALEGRQDFVRLDEARRRDQQRAVDRLQLLKPDARRISESLLGEQLHLQLQQMLSWIETARSYQQGLQAPEPVRARGMDFEFPLLNPTPRFLCRNAAVSGTISIDGEPRPFQASLRDLASDPALHGRPTIARLEAAGSAPLKLVLRHDATGEVATTDVGLDLLQPKTISLAAGDEDRQSLSMAIQNLHWLARLTLTDGQIHGRIDLSSDVSPPQITAKNEIAGSLAAAATKSLADIRTVNATINVDGSLRKPNIDMDSDLGPKFATAFESAFQTLLPDLRNQLTNRIETLVAERKAEFAQKFQDRSQQLMHEHQQIIDGLTEAYAIAKDLQNGNVDPDRMFRLASETGVLKEKDQQKADKYLKKHGEVMDQLQNPEQTIQKALPGLTRKLFNRK